MSRRRKLAQRAVNAKHRDQLRTLLPQTATDESPADQEAVEHPNGAEAPTPKPQPLTETTSPYRMRWAALLARVFAVDVTTCVKCGGAMVFLALLTDPVVVTKFLDHIGVPSTPPEPAPRRLEQTDLFEFEAWEAEGGLAAPAAPARAPPAVRWLSRPS